MVDEMRQMIDERNQRWDDEARARAIRALRILADPSDVVIDRILRKNLHFRLGDIGGMTMGRSQTLREHYCFLHLSDESGPVEVRFPHQAPNPRNLNPDGIRESIADAVRAARTSIEATPYSASSREACTALDLIRPFLAVHAARELAKLPGQPYKPWEHPTVASTHIPVTDTRSPTVTVYIHTTGKGIRLIAPEGVDPFPMPPFRGMLSVTRWDENALRVEVGPIRTTGSISRLPSDPMKAVHMIRRPDVPMLLRVGA